MVAHIPSFTMYTRDLNTCDNVIKALSSSRDLAPSLGDGKILRGPRFLNDVFFWKNFHFHAENFSRPFLFSRRPGFSDFPYLYCIKCRIWPFRHKKNHYFKKEFLDNTSFFTLFVLSRVSDNTTSQNIGGTDAWTVPPPQILGDRPPRPPKSPPLVDRDSLKSKSTMSVKMSNIAQSLGS